MRPLIIAGLLFALLASSLPARAAEGVGTMTIRLRQPAPVVIDYSQFAAHDFSDGADVLSASSRCLAFHNHDPRPATAVRFAFVYYDGGGVRAGSQIYTRTGTFGTDIRQGVREGFSPSPSDCFLMHLPDASQITIAEYVDSVDFADGSKWVAQALTFPDRVIPHTLIPAAPAERPQTAANVLAPAVAGTFANCAAVKTLPPAALENSAFVSAEPGAPIGDGLFHIGSASVCSASGDAARDALALDVIKTMPAAILRSAAFRVYFPELSVAPTCTAPVRLMERKLLETPAAGRIGRPQSGDFVGLAHVTVRADGFPADVKIARSSNDTSDDEALRESALATRYWPALQNGVPVAGTFDFPMRWVIDVPRTPGERISVSVFGPPSKLLPAECLIAAKAN